MDYLEQARKLKAMAHPARLQILDMLRAGETCVCHIERALGRRQAYISQQLMVLREAGLVESRKEGLQVYYWLTDADLDALLALLCGPAIHAEQSAIDGCPCPACAVVSPA